MAVDTRPLELSPNSKKSQKIKFPSAQNKGKNKASLKEKQEKQYLSSTQML